MSTHAVYVCGPCDLKLELNGYAEALVPCPQCAGIMDLNSYEHRYHSQYMSNRHYTPSPRIYAPLLPPPDKLLESMMDRSAIEALIEDKVAERLTAIDKTAANARLTAESLRQSVIDQQSALDRSRTALDDVSQRQQRDDNRRLTQINDLTTAVATQQTARIEAADKIETLADASEVSRSRLAQLEEKTQRIEMSYIEEETKTATATAANPTIVEALKALGSVAGTAATIGLTAEFVREGSTLVLTRAHVMGLITQEQAESEMIRGFVATALPAILFVCAQYDWCPKRELVGKISSVAVSGQVAEKSAQLTQFGLALGKDLLALPSAKGLEAQLAAAE